MHQFEEFEFPRSWYLHLRSGVRANQRRLAASFSPNSAHDIPSLPSASTTHVASIVAE